jgi:hypothetical protein
MQILKLDVPSGIRYMSEWKDYRIYNFPHILNKQIPGCGYTEYCIRNSDDTILCSPRKILLQNKYEQHPDTTFLVVNTYESEVGTDKDLTKYPRVRRTFGYKKFNLEKFKKAAKQKEDFFKELTYKISTYIKACRFNNRPVKILVTYDSFRIVKDIIRHQDSLENFQIVVDEFQSIFTDSKFKSDTEMQFVYNLQGIQRVCYVSATPMIEKYLDMLDDFKNLPYYELDWEAKDPGRVSKPKIITRNLKSVYMEAGPIIKDYLDGKFEYRYVRDPESDNEKDVKKIESKEAVFYVNSVNNITSIIKRAGLTPEQVNILVANTPENVTRIKKNLGAKYKIGTVPLRDEPRKMFTFCTRTVYLGADFYSDNARSFIISDANIDTLAVDITLDLPQILGRQRLRENPWKDEAILFFKSITTGNKQAKEIFDKKLAKKEKTSENLLSVFQKGNNEEKGDLSVAYQKLAKTFNYKDDFVAVNRIKVGDKTILTPVFNNLVKVSELRAYEIQQVDYSDRFTVFNELGKVGGVDDVEELEKFFKEYKEQKNRIYKLKYLCEYCEKVGNTSILQHIEEKRFSDYINVLGLDRCKAEWYNTYLLDKRLSVMSFDKEKIKGELSNVFEVGKSYTKADIKGRLSDIYKKLGYKASPKATDLGEYYEMKECLVNNGAKRSGGFKILKEKEE